MKLSYPRSWRTYIGGKKLDKWLDLEKCEDSDHPELWISSTTQSISIHDKLEDSLSQVTNLNNQFLKDLIEEDPIKLLGINHYNKFGTSLGFLTKIIDSYKRLVIQVHPNKKFAKEHFNSDYGKTEAWYILGTRDNDSCIYLGFKEHVTKSYWEEVYYKQDIKNMLECLHKINVKNGDFFLIEGGLPHSIGAGVFLIEVQEPTDLTFRTEKISPMGLPISDNLIHQNLGEKVMFDCFDYKTYNLDELLKKCKINSNLVKNESYLESTLLDINEFSMKEVNVFKEYDYFNKDFSVFVIVDGNGQITYNDEVIDVKKADLFFLPNTISNVKFISNNMQIFIETPPKN